MVSDTQKTERIRRRKRATDGRKHKKARTRKGTPRFPIHPGGETSGVAEREVSASAR